MANLHKRYAEAKDFYVDFFSVISGESVKFPGFIKTLKNEFSPTWSEENVFGRQDPITTFQNTKRSLSLSFEVPSYGIREATDNMLNLNKLINFLYPGYSRSNAANTIAASPLVRIKFSSLLYDQSSGDADGREAADNGLLCAITSFDHEFYFDESGGWIDERGNLVPSKFTVSLAATVQHGHDVGYVDGAYRDEYEYPYRVRSRPNTFGPTEELREVVNSFSQQFGRNLLSTRILPANAGSQITDD